MENNKRNTRIEDLKLRNKTKCILIESGKTTLGDLFDMNKSSFLSTPGLGGAIFNEIKELLYTEYKHNIPGAEVSEKNEDGTINPSKFYVHDFEIGGHLKGTLEKNNIKTLEDLLKYDEEELFELKDLGVVGFKELRNYLSNFSDKYQTTKKAVINENGTADPSKFYVQDFDVSIAIKNSLCRHGIFTLEDLLKTDEEDLMRIEGLGPLRLKELSKFLSKNGHNLILGFDTNINEDETINPKEVRIGNLKLRDKINNILIKNNIRTLDDLLKQDFNSLKSIPKFDDDCILDLEIALNELGYSIKGFEEASSPKETNTLKLSLKNNNNNNK